jgi:hypothetical protein
LDRLERRAPTALARLAIGEARTEARAGRLQEAAWFLYHAGCQEAARELELRLEKRLSSAAVTWGGVGPYGKSEKYTLELEGGITGIFKPDQEGDGGRRNAGFVNGAEIATYRMARRLGFAAVPVTVRREWASLPKPVQDSLLRLGAKPRGGSLQYFIRGSTMLHRAWRGGATPLTRHGIRLDRTDQKAFEMLVADPDRAPVNSLATLVGTIGIDYAEAFTLSQYIDRTVRSSQAFMQRARALTRAEANEDMGDVLAPARIDAFMARLQAFVDASSGNHRDAPR